MLRVNIFNNPKRRLNFFRSDPDPVGPGSYPKKCNLDPDPQPWLPLSNVADPGDFYPDPFSIFEKKTDSDPTKFVIFFLFQQES